MTRLPTALLATITVVSLVAGCGADTGDPVATSATPASPSTSASSPSTSSSPASPTVQPSYARPARGTLLAFTRIRVRQHRGHDRIVMTFTGPGRPGWSVGYVEQPRLEGSGDRVWLSGDAFLGVFAAGTTWPVAGYYGGPQRIRPSTGDIAEVYVGGTFEGATQVLVGIDEGRVPVHVRTLQQPTRLVVDLE